MPIRNQLFGVYKLLELKTSDSPVTYTPYLAETASRDRTMKVSAKNFIQGTAKSRVLDIGEITETFKFKLPILVGGAASLDGRSMIVTYLKKALDENTTTLPLIKSATISISSDQGASVDIDMLSDGRPSAAPFRVTNRPVDGISGSPLDPSGDNGPSRTAKFYDFRAKIGKFIYYIMDAKITITVDTQQKYFIAGKDSGSWNSQQFVSNAMVSPYRNPLNSTDSNNYYNFNTQFPFIGVAGISVEGSGTAAVELTQAGEDTNYDFDNYNNGQVESINVDLTTNGGPDGNNYELTWQLPGQVRTAAMQAGDPSQAGFTLEIWTPTTWNGSGGEWKSLFYDPTTMDDVINLDNSVVSSSNFQISTGVMTANFKFNCWVK